MILRGLEVRHWRCIRQVKLANLPPGIVIIHGPNRTGKTSLVRALRAGLFDLSPTSTGQKMDCHKPISGEGPPQVIVEFATGGAEYRLTKVFGSGSAGKGILEQKTGADWLTLEKAPKEAHRKVHELLGADQSTAGLNRLLWLTQGEVALPEPKELTGNLEARLIQVLGVLVTGRDLVFKEALAEKLRRWFTDKGKEKTKSPLADLREQIEANQDELRKRQTQWQSLEGAVGRLQTLQESLPLRRREAHDAAEDVKKLRAEKEQTQVRVKEHLQAQQQLERAKSELSTVKKQLEDCRRLTEALAAKRADESRLLKEDVLAQENSKRLADNVTTIDGHVLAARKAEDDHAKGREAIQDRRTLLTLADKSDQLAKVLEELDRLVQDVAKLEEDLQKASAPDAATLKSLRDNRKEAGGLEADLRAAELTIQVQFHKPGVLELALDGKVETVQVAAGDKLQRTARQRAQLEFPGFLTLHLGRARDNLAIEDQYRRLAELDHAFQDMIRSFGENPADESCLDRLAERRRQNDGWTNKLGEKRKAAQAKAPKGRGVLQAEMDRLGQQRGVVLERRADLAGWTPNQLDIDSHEQQLQDAGRALQGRRANLETTLRTAGAERQQADKGLAALRLQLAEARALIGAHRQDLARQGDVADLAQRQAMAQAAHDQAVRLDHEHQLTEAEQTIDERCKLAEETLNLRIKRLQEATDQLHDLRVAVGDHQGLHAALADAEATKNALEAQLIAEELEAHAHRLLADLFDQSRENQVQQVMGPVADRVLGWARIAGLDGIAEVRFGDNFLPQGLHMRQGDHLTPLALEEESFGAVEQLGLLVRLALGGVLANQETVVAILDDPLAHADLEKHRRLQDVFRLAAAGNLAAQPPAGPMQIIILTCHPERFDYLPEAHCIDLAQALQAAST